MRIKLLSLGVCLFLVVPCVILAETAIILKQENSPLKVSEYIVKYSAYEGDHINHRIKIINTSDKKIVAYRMGFVAFDAFNEYIDKFHGL